MTRYYKKFDINVSYNAMNKIEAMSRWLNQPYLDCNDIEDTIYILNATIMNGRTSVGSMFSSMSLQICD